MVVAVHWTMIHGCAYCADVGDTVSCCGLLREDWLLNTQEVFVEAPAGSVVFTHCGILHAGSVNRLPTTRFFISCYINRVGLPVRDIQQGPVRLHTKPKTCKRPAGVCTQRVHNASKCSMLQLYTPV